MPAMMVEPDALTDGEQIRYGTGLHRINEALDTADAEADAVELYAGDIRDALRGLHANAFKPLRDKLKGKPAGELVSVATAEARKLVAAALNPASAAP